MPPTKTRSTGTVYMEACEAATGRIDGTPFVLAPGEILAASHEIVRTYPHFFKPLDRDRQRPDVEQATAEPGEKRGER